MKTLLIDGNNLIHKVQHLKNLFLKDKTLSQETLVQSLSGKLKGYGSVVIVFDGHGNFSKNNVVFSESRSADELIRKKIEEFKNPRLLRVVSSDNEILNFAKVCGCERSKSEDFWKEFNPASVTKDKNINQRFIYGDEEKPEFMSRREIDEFRKKFS